MSLIDRYDFLNTGEVKRAISICSQLHNIPSNEKIKYVDDIGFNIKERENGERVQQEVGNMYIN